MKDLLLYILKHLVENPDDVFVTETTNPSGEILLEVKVNPEDMGLIIGKGGKVIKSIRNLVRTKAIVENKRFNLVLLEEN